MHVRGKKSKKPCSARDHDKKIRITTQLCMNRACIISEHSEACLLGFSGTSKNCSNRPFTTSFISTDSLGVAAAASSGGGARLAGGQWVGLLGQQPQLTRDPA